MIMWSHSKNTCHTHIAYIKYTRIKTKPVPYAYEFSLRRKQRLELFPRFLATHIVQTLNTVDFETEKSSSVWNRKIPHIIHNGMVELPRSTSGPLMQTSSADAVEGEISCAVYTRIASSSTIVYSWFTFHC